jgi:hypothetical protein
MNPDLSEELTLPQRFAAIFFLPQSLFPSSAVAFESFGLLAGWLALRLPLLLFLTLLTYFFISSFWKGLQGKYTYFTFSLCGLRQEVVILCFRNSTL